MIMIKLAIIEDNLRYMDLLKTMLLSTGNIALVYSCGHAKELLSSVRKHSPDVIIMDIDLPGKSGIEGVLEVKEMFPEIRVLMLTVFEEEEKIFSAIKAGADGYLLKKDTPQKIIDSVTEVFEGKAPMNSMIAKKVLEYFQKKAVVTDAEEYHLTRREQEVLEMLMEGFSYKEIAAKCFISVQTLNSHIKNIYQKLGVHSRAEIAARYRK